MLWRKSGETRGNSRKRQTISQTSFFQKKRRFVIASIAYIRMLFYDEKTSNNFEFNFTVSRSFRFIAVLRQSNLKYVCTDLSYQLCRNQRQRKFG